MAFEAVVFTHPDVDHILGNQAVPLDVPRWGDEQAQKDILAQETSELEAKEVFEGEEHASHAPHSGSGLSALADPATPWRCQEKKRIFVRAEALEY